MYIVEIPNKFRAIPIIVSLSFEHWAASTLCILSVVSRPILY